MSYAKKTPTSHGEIASKAEATLAANQARLISKPEVLDRVGVTYPTLWLWMRRGSFPRSRALGGKGPAGKVAWIESEVEAWIAALPVRRLRGDGESA